MEETGILEKTNLLDSLLPDGEPGQNPVQNKVGPRFCVEVGSDLLHGVPTMGRAAKPWYRKDRDAWYVNVQGKRIKLVDGKANRNEAYRRFLAIDPKEQKATTAKVTGQEVCALFLQHANANLKSSTYAWHKHILDAFSQTVKKLDGNGVQPKDVTRHLDAHSTWGKTTRHNVVASIKRAWKWAKDEGHITVNPLADLKKPRAERREENPDDSEVATFIATAKPDFRVFLDFLYHTGCRPGEARIIEKRHVDLVNREIRFRIGEDKTSGKTGRHRVIHLNDQATKIIEGLIRPGIVGPLFRNSRGRPWTSDALSCAVRRIRLLTGLDGRTVCYALRHQYITDALARGVPIATVAEMTGTSPEMIAKVYSHLSDKKVLLLAAANQVRPTNS